MLTETLAWEGRTVAWGRIGEGPPVVMCHGTPWSSALWEPYAKALASRYTVYLWDMPGYGRSSMDPAHAVDLGEQGRLFADLLTWWGVSRPHVIAHDFGGAVSLRALLLHQATYASLALVDVVALRPWGSPYFQVVRDHADTFAAVPPAIHRGALEAYVQTAAHRPLRAEDLAMLVAPWVTEVGQGAFYRQIQQADERYTAEVEDRLGEIALPVKIIWGADDAWIPPDRADRLAETIPEAEVLLIPDAGHLVQLDAPVALATALTSWLTQHEPGG